LRRIIDASEHHVTHQGEDDGVGVQRAQPAERSPRQPEIELPEVELRGDEDAHQHAHGTPDDGGEHELTHNAVVEYDRNLTVSQGGDQCDMESVRTSAEGVPIRGVSSASGSNASLSELPKRRRECSRRKKTTKVKTRQRQIVRVSGTTDMVGKWLRKTGQWNGQLLQQKGSSFHSEGVSLTSFDRMGIRNKSGLQRRKTSDSNYKFRAIHEQPAIRKYSNKMHIQQLNEADTTCDGTHDQSD
jgi:hypothetical protein